MSELPANTESFIEEFDAAIEAHMNWTRRILRCAVLKETPGEDVLHPMAHTLCQFGNWFTEQHALFEAIDATATRRIAASHQSMHDAIRNICTDVLSSKPGRPDDLEQFESSQSELLSLLTNLKNHVIARAAQIDPLTELPLRHRIEADFERCHKDAVRKHSLLYVAMIDIDHFKRINDQYGHPAGDTVLRKLAQSLKQAMRAGDHLYRYGGEEFLWLMRCHYAEEAELTARRTVISARTHAIQIDDTTRISISITLGMVQVTADEDLTSAILRADHALYKGKSKGRNMYIIEYN